MMMMLINDINLVRSHSITKYWIYIIIIWIKYLYFLKIPSSLKNTINYFECLLSTFIAFEEQQSNPC